MSRVFIIAVVAFLLFGGVLAADQALQNPEMEPSSAGADADQQQFTETGGELVKSVVPVFMLVLVVGAMLVGVRTFGGGI